MKIAALLLLVGLAIVLLANSSPLSIIPVVGAVWLMASENGSMDSFYAAGMLLCILGAALLALG